MVVMVVGTFLVLHVTAISVLHVVSTLGSSHGSKMWSLVAFATDFTPHGLESVGNHCPPFAEKRPAFALLRGCFGFRWLGIQNHELAIQVLKACDGDIRDIDGMLLQSLELKINAENLFTRLVDGIRRSCHEAPAGEAECSTCPSARLFTDVCEGDIRRNLRNVRNIRLACEGHEWRIELDSVQLEGFRLRSNRHVQELGSQLGFRRSIQVGILTRLFLTFSTQVTPLSVRWPNKQPAHSTSRREVKGSTSPSPLWTCSNETVEGRRKAEAEAARASAPSEERSMMSCQ